MRVLSFIPAFLLAAASFVVAAPAPSPDNSCVSNPTGGSGNDAPLQPVISIFQNTTTYLQPLSDQLTTLHGDSSCTPDAVAAIVVEITAVVQVCVDQLKVAASVDLTSVDLINLGAVICTLLQLVITIVNTLVAIIALLGVEACATIQAVLSACLNICLSLVVCIQVYVAGSIAAILGPLCAVVTGIVKLCLSVIIGVQVSV